MDLEPNLAPGRVFVLDLGSPDESGQSLRAIKALASEPRLDILRLLNQGERSVKDIAEALEMPLSTATLHIRALEEGGLITTELSSATRGLQKVCSRRYDMVLVRLPGEEIAAGKSVQASIPIGTYTDCHAEAPCGLAGSVSAIGLLDDPASFFEPGRVDAQLLWLTRGWVEYRIPHRLPSGARPLSLALTLELCSEAPLHNLDWPSDITFWINGVEAATWTSPGDFGGRRGVLTPAWWESYQTQYGLLKQVTVGEQGTYIDGMRASDVTLADLGLGADGLLRLRVGVKADAANPGGMNLFGRAFGNYPQDIVFQLRYE